MNGSQRARGRPGAVLLSAALLLFSIMVAPSQSRGDSDDAVDRRSLRQPSVPAAGAVERAVVAAGVHQGAVPPTSSSLRQDFVNALRNEWRNFLLIAVAAVLFWIGLARIPKFLYYALGVVFIGFGGFILPYTSTVHVQCIRSGTVSCHMRLTMGGWPIEERDFVDVRAVRLRQEASAPSGGVATRVGSVRRWTGSSHAGSVYRVMMETRDGAYSLLPYATDDEDEGKRIADELNTYLSSGDASRHTVSTGATAFFYISLMMILLGAGFLFYAVKGIPYRARRTRRSTRGSSAKRGDSDA